MFTVPQPPPVKLSQMHAYLKNFKATYARYQPKARVACDECIAVLHEASGFGPMPMGAKMTRRGGDKTLRLCSQHATLWRDLDGVGKKAGRG